MRIFPGIDWWNVSDIDHYILLCKNILRNNIVVRKFLYLHALFYFLNNIYIAKELYIPSVYSNMCTWLKKLWKFIEYYHCFSQTIARWNLYYSCYMYIYFIGFICIYIYPVDRIHFFDCPSTELSFFRLRHFFDSEGRWLHVGKCQRSWGYALSCV